MELDQLKLVGNTFCQTWISFMNSARARNFITFSKGKMSLEKEQIFEDSDSYDSSTFSDQGRLKMKPGIQKATQSTLSGWLRENLLLVITFSGVSCGVLLGLFLRRYELDNQTINYIAYPGELFMRLLKLMILPLIIASLITGKSIIEKCRVQNDTDLCY